VFVAVTETSQAASRALDDLYRQHGAAVYRYALAVLGNRADAEDVTQTTFLNAYRSLEQGVRPRKPANWLLTIASNTIKQRVRQEKSRPHEVELDERVAGTSPEEDGPTVGEILTALSKIPPQQRQAIVLREFEGRSYNEIAEILGVTTSALETLLFRARRSLSEELEHHLTCTEAQLAVSRATDGRLGRKERRRLREHLDECPDCASFARLQQRHGGALRTLLLVPVPLSLSLFKGFEGSAVAATLPTALPAAGLGAAAATTGVGAAGATGGGLLAGGVALKAAAVVTAATVATGGVVGASELTAKEGKKTPSPALVKPGKSATAPGRSVTNGKAVGKSTAPGQARASGGPAPGQARASGGPAPGQVRKQATPSSSRRNDRAQANKPATKSPNPSRRPEKPKQSLPAKTPKPVKPVKPSTPRASSGRGAGSSKQVTPPPKKPAKTPTQASGGGRSGSNDR
jgi:RNA polymerase sigma factor (sigma-70 family)